MAVKFQLGLMTGLVSHKLKVPGSRVRPIRLRQRKKVHPLWRPGHGSVGRGVMGMEHHRHLPLPLSRHKTKAEAYCRAEFFKKGAVIDGKGIGPFRIDYLIIRRFYGVPAEITGVVAGEHKLSAGRNNCP